MAICAEAVATSNLKQAMGAFMEICVELFSQPNVPDQATASARRC
jgi:hypothetical protein